MTAFKSVLLVDDSRASNFMHREMIREADFAERVDVALDGEEALEFLRSGDLASEFFPPSIILLDINMPRMDGFEFLEACKELPEVSRRSTIIVMVTTSLDPGDRDRALATGMVSDFHSKPLSLASLEEMKSLKSI
jgi:CheY-like chemotaxis protein